jgi:hypothetical protein
MTRVKRFGKTGYSVIFLFIDDYRVHMEKSVS